MKSNLLKTLAALALGFSITNCGKDKDDEKAPVQDAFAGYTSVATSEITQIPVVVNADARSLEITEDSVNALEAIENETAENIAALQKGCKYTLAKGQYAFTGLFYPLVETVPTLEIEDESGKKALPTFNDSIASAILKASSDSKEIHRLRISFKRDFAQQKDYIWLSCEYLVKK